MTLPFVSLRHERKSHRRGGIAPNPFRVRFKSGGGQNTVQTQSGPPPQVLANYQGVYNQAQNVAGQPYQAYNSPTVAGFNPTQEAGFNNINTAINSSQPFINASQPFIGQASNYINNAATALDPSHFGATVANYQSPYTQQVVNATEGQFNNQNAIQQNQLRGNAASAGAFGGDRQAVAQAVLAGQQQAQQAPVIAGLYNTGFQNATNAAQSNAWLNSQAGFGMANLGQQEANLGALTQNLGLQGANAQLQAGAQQQAQAQQQLNAPYQQFLAAQGYPFQITNWLEGMATGTGGASGGIGTTTSPGPSPISQIAGLGIAGLGAYGAYTRGAGGTGSAAPTSGGQDYIADGTWDGARGGRIPGMAAGGGLMGGRDNLLTNGDTSVNLMGTGGNMLGEGVGGNLLTTPTGSTSTTPGPDHGSDIGQLIRLGGQIAAAYYGGPAAGAAAGWANQQSWNQWKRGGGIHGDINDHAMRAGVIPSRHFDAGGGVTPGLSASVAGNPMQEQMVQSYNGLPTEQLQELSVRFPPTTPQGAMVQRALQARRMNPGANPAQPQVAGMGGMPPGSASPLYAEGGEVDDDDMMPAFHIPEAGPSVPGGLMAGLQPMTAQVAAPTASRGAVPSEKRGSYTPPPAEFLPLVVAAAERHNVDPKPLAWLLSQESHWNPRAYNQSSGTIGIGQFKPATAREVGIDPWDPRQAIEGSAKYLRQMLDKHGGGSDYERAISRYGTFSTGHGAEADNAVRNQYRAFMQGAARGGAVMLRADGGGTDDDSFYQPILRRLWNADWRGPAQQANDKARSELPPDAASTGWLNLRGSVPPGSPAASTGDPYGANRDVAEPTPAGDPYGPNRGNAGIAQEGYGDLPVPPISPVAGMGRAPRGGGSGGGGSDTIPTPPMPPGEKTATPTPQAGMGGTQHDDQSLKPNWGEALIAAGLGMMGGTSPHAAVNIGQGGLAGLKNYQQQRQLAVQDQIRRDTAATNLVWRQGQLQNMAERNKTYSQNADTAGIRANAYADYLKIKGEAVPEGLALKDRQLRAKQEMDAFNQKYKSAGEDLKERVFEATQRKWQLGDWHKTISEIQKSDAPDPLTGKRPDPATSIARRNALAAGAGPSPTQPSTAPAPGLVAGFRDPQTGYTFKGGNPNDKANWDAP